MIYLRMFYLFIYDKDDYHHFKDALTFVIRICTNISLNHFENSQSFETLIKQLSRMFYLIAV